MRRTKEEAAETKAQIIACAAKLFRENGIARTSVADVMQAAGLTHGGFYRHFGSKDELLLAAMRAILAEFGAEARVRLQLLSKAL